MKLKSLSVFKILAAALLLMGAVGMSAVAAESANHPVRVACIGDSITFGLGITNAAEKYPAQLQKLLGTNYDVRNFGHSGCTVTRDTFSKWPRGYIKQVEHTNALAFAPDIVICNLGINDTSPFADAHRQNFVRDYLAIISAYRALPSKPRFILWHPLAPLYPGHKTYGKPVVAEVNMMIRQVAGQTGAEVIDMDTPLEGHPEWFRRDHIHPNAKGARHIAEITRDYLIKK